MIINLLLDEAYPLISAILAMVIAQSLKIIFISFREKSFRVSSLFSSGGMPSSHAAMVVGLSTAIGLTEGFFSNIFYVCAIFSFVVLYDATGVRHAAGKHASILNRLIADFIAKDKFQHAKLTEILGHSPREGCIGALVGIASATLLF